MSAFVVVKDHIDALVALAVRGPSGATVSPDTAWHGVRWIRNPEASWRDADFGVKADHANADELGAMLWTENVRSIHARYPDTIEGGEYPGPIDFDPAQVMSYVWPMTTPRLSAVAGLKALDCYEYQSCEHVEWTSSEAYRFCDALRRSLIGHLPGYDSAQWEVDFSELGARS